MIRLDPEGRAMRDLWSRRSAALRAEPQDASQAKPAAAIARDVRSRDLGDGPHRPFGSALVGGDGGHVSRLPRIGRTVKPKAAGPCKVCGERHFFCDCEDEQ